MSTIQRAFQKRFSGRPDFESELSTLDHVNLFPVPEGRQYEEFVQLANMLMELKSPDHGAVICIAGSVKGEGSSFVSYNVARQLAFVMNRRVLWVDANHKSPQRKLLSQEGQTFAELLADPDSYVGSPGGTKLQVLPAGAEIASCTRYLASDGYPSLLAAFSGIYDFTIMDCPPILECVETGLLAAPTNGLIAVVERQRLKWEIIRAGLEMMTSKRVNVLGTVFNRRRYELPKFIYDRI